MEIGIFFIKKTYYKYLVLKKQCTIFATDKSL